MVLGKKNRAKLASVRAKDRYVDKNIAMLNFEGHAEPKSSDAVVRRLSLPELDRLTNETASRVLRYSDYQDGRHSFVPLLKLYDSRSKAGKLTPKHAAMVIKHARLALKYNNPETAFQIMKRGISAGAITAAHSKDVLGIAEEVALPPKGPLRNNLAYVNTVGGELLDTAVSRKVLGKEHVDLLLQVAKRFENGRPDSSAPFYKAAIKAGNLKPSLFDDAFLRMSANKVLSTGVESSGNPLRSAVVLRHGIESGALKASDPRVKARFSELGKKAKDGFLTWGTKPGDEIAAMAKKLGVKD